jgi:hypothetical protein
MPVNFSLSPDAADDVFDFCNEAQFEEDAAQEAMVKVCAAAESFVHTFSPYPFLLDEPVHEFDALTIYLKVDVQQKRNLRLRMTVRDDKIYLFSLREVAVDDLYEARKCICESHFPCYNDPVSF